MQRCNIIVVIAVLLSAIYKTGYSQNTSQKYLTDTIPAQWTYTSDFSQESPVTDKWWKSFNDPDLDALIDIGVKNNYDVLTAARRIKIAQASIKMAESDYYPSVAVDAGWIRNRSAANLTAQNSPNITSEYFNLGLNFSWQIDLFGQITQQVKEKKSQWKASRSQYDGAMVTLCGNIATAYIQLRVWQNQYSLAVTHIKSQKIVSDMAEARFKSGLASMLDVSQARTVYYSTLSTLPTLNAAIETQINSIATLLGVYPDEIKPMLQAYKPLPDYRQIVSVGVPLELLRRRPDIQTAEYLLAADAAAVGVAKKDFLPVLTLNGTVGFDSHNIKNIFTKDAFNYTIEPKLSWTVFDGLLRNNSVISAKEQMQISIENYNNTILMAYQDVENAMITYKYSLLNIDAVNPVISEANKSLELSIDLYKKGLSAFTNVVDAQLSLLEYSNSLITARGKAITSLIALYESLGGGWEVK